MVGCLPRTWPRRLMARISDFQSEEEGSEPFGAAILMKQENTFDIVPKDFYPFGEYVYNLYIVLLNRPFGRKVGLYTSEWKHLSPNEKARWSLFAREIVMKYLTIEKQQNDVAPVA